MDRCSWKSCRHESTIGYLGKGMCGKHWNMFCQWDDEGKLDKARAKIGLKPKEQIVYKIVNGELVRKDSLPVETEIKTEAEDASITPTPIDTKMARPTRKRRGKKRMPRGYT